MSASMPRAANSSINQPANSEPRCHHFSPSGSGWLSPVPCTVIIAARFVAPSNEFVTAVIPRAEISSKDIIASLDRQFEIRGSRADYAPLFGGKSKRTKPVFRFAKLQENNQLTAVAFSSERGFVQNARLRRFARPAIFTRIAYRSWPFYSCFRKAQFSFIRPNRAQSLD